ncbi:DUF523 domain-containing protein, partial [Vibrio parahaemolyticus]|uniref:2-thiouracil desulfurase family protein n=1 Tax=Vibrio parahaemolyticus TaxID=670 RepID=UPI00146D8F5F|nr:DUF523 domain-containing protein [Vibrio parahaemolyticus]
MVKGLVSSCLVGNNVRYNASCLSVKEPELHWLKSNAELVTFCPEVSAGLPIPRAPAEVITGKGVDVRDGLANVVGDDGIGVTEQV